MARVRILVDGHGLLKSWEQVAAGKPRQTTQSRLELVNRLTQFYDAEGIPITIVFDGSDTDEEELPSTQEVEVVYAKRGQSADQTLVRLSDRYRKFGEVLIVTDVKLQDAPAPQRQVEACDVFAKAAEQALADLARDISQYNQQNDSRFQRSRLR